MILEPVVADLLDLDGDEHRQPQRGGIVRSDPPLSTWARSASDWGTTLRLDLDSLPQPNRALALVLVSQLAWGPSWVWAESPSTNPHLIEAKSALDEGALDRTSTELHKALSQAGSSDDDRVEIYKLEGIVALSKGDTAGAKKALSLLLQVRPDYVLAKGASPKLRQLFAEAQADARQPPRQGVALEFNPPAQLTAGGPARFTARVSSLPDGAKGALWFRHQGTGDFERLDLVEVAGELSATLPGDKLPIEGAPYSLDYYLEVVDGEGHRLGGIGDARAALSTPVQAFEPKRTILITSDQVPATESPWYGHWYIWAGVGVLAAVGAGTAVYFATRPTTGTLPVTVTVNSQ